MDNFVCRENIKHFRQQLEAGVAPARRATLLPLLVEEENNLGLTREHLYLLDHQISRLSEIMARQMDLIDNIRSLGQSAERAQMVLATMNELMATYIAHRQKVSAALA